MMGQLGPDAIFMMGDNPALSKMPEKPKLLDFFRQRFSPFTRNHLLQSAMVALKSGMEEKGGAGVFAARHCQWRVDSC